MLFLRTGLLSDRCTDHSLSVSPCAPIIGPDYPLFVSFSAVLTRVHILTFGKDLKQKSCTASRKFSHLELMQKTWKLTPNERAMEKACERPKVLKMASILDTKRIASLLHNGITQLFGPNPNDISS